MKRLLGSLFISFTLAACAAGDDDASERRGPDMDATPDGTSPCGAVPDVCASECDPETGCGTCCMCEEGEDGPEWTVWAIDCFPDPDAGPE